MKLTEALFEFKKDFSFSALIAGLIIVLVGMTSSAVVVFQAAQAFGASTREAGSWLGSLCIGIGIMTVFFSVRYRSPILIAWSTPGAVLLVTGGAGFSLPEAIGAFLFSAFLIFLFGVTGWFQKIKSRISISLTSALLAGVLLHFCLDAFQAFSVSPILIGSMLIAYLIGKKIWSQMTMLIVLSVGLIVSMSMGLLQFGNAEYSLTQFKAVMPVFSVQALISLGIPLFVVTMASQNLTGLAVMRANQYTTPISPLLTGTGLMNLITAFFGGFAINLAAITAAIGMGPEAHPDRNKRYVGAVIAGTLYIFVGIFAGAITSLFAAFPKEMVSAIAGLALLGTVASGIEKALAMPQHREAAFLTFVIAASGLTFYGIGAAFWAVLVGVIVIELKI